MQLKIEIVSDVICPWCFIGKRRFEKALQLLQPGIETEVHWCPFELNPDMPAGGMSRRVTGTTAGNPGRPVFPDRWRRRDYFRSAAAGDTGSSLSSSQINNVLTPR